MRVARYWAKAEVMGPGDPRDPQLASGRCLFTIWRGSDESEADAERAASSAAREWQTRIARGESLDSYSYAMFSRPEPLIEELTGAAGERVGAVTVNRVGCNVLNTSDVAFVDVDTAPVPGFFGRLFGTARVPVDPLVRLRRWVDGRRAVHVRVYRTYAGYRYLVTCPPMEPASDETQEMFRELGADDRYAALCRAHNNFRARLSPKPWRLRRIGPPPAPISVEPPPEDRARELAAWHAKYEGACGEHAVCELIEELGDGTPTPDARQVIALHDAACRVGSGLPLA